jgi:hypothetical protein
MANNQIELKGFFVKDQAFKEELFGETRVQKFVFLVPGYVDSFGDKKGKDEFWELSIMGDRIDEFKLPKTILESFKAKVTCYINSKLWYQKEDIQREKPQFSIYAVVAKIEHVK